MSDNTRSNLLPVEPFDRAMAALIGLPDGAHTQPATVQTVDPYGNVTIYVVQTVRWAEGLTLFVQSMSATKPERYVLPPKVTALIARQAAAVSTIIRRRQGKRLAEQARANGHVPAFSPEARAKALATRRAKAAKRRARRKARA